MRDMKRAFYMIMVLSLALTTGCDGLRKLAGRPTSDELESLRLEVIEARESEQARLAEQQARIDSLKRVEQALADSLAVIETLRQMNGTILNPSAMGGLFTTKLDYRYYIIVGAFSYSSNAEKLLGRVNDAGYSGTLISFRNGYNAIGVAPGNDLNSALASLVAVKKEPFCPPDAWILVND